MLYHVTHTTHYAYESDVSVAFLTLRLQPRELPWQRCLDHHIVSAPDPAMTHWHVDYHGNTCVRLDLYTPHSEFEITASSRVEVLPRELPEPADTPPWEEVVRACGSDVFTPDSAAGEFVFDSPHIAPVRNTPTTPRSPSRPAGRSWRP